MNNYSSLGQRGMGGFGILMFIIILLIILMILGQGTAVMHACGGGDRSFIECALDLYLGDDEEKPAPEGSVTATGSISGEFNGKTGSVDISMTIPLEGGAVTGSFSGDCDGNINGNYDKDSGAITGTGGGSCAFVIPAKGSFSGSVNKSAKTVSVNGTGSAMGFSKRGSMTLSY